MEQQKKTLLKLSDIVAEYSIPKSTVYHLLKHDNDFPKQISLSSRSVVWKRAEVDAWVDKRQAMAVAS